MAANAITATDPTGAAVRAWAPLSQLLAVELVQRVHVPGRWRRTVLVVSAGSVGAIGMIASYGHLSALVSSTGESGFIALMVPASVDLLMLSGTAALLWGEPAQMDHPDQSVIDGPPVAHEPPRAAIHEPPNEPGGGPVREPAQPVVHEPPDEPPHEPVRVGSRARPDRARTKARAVSAGDAVVAYLAQNPGAPTAEVVEATGVSRSTVKRVRERTTTASEPSAPNPTRRFAVVNGSGPTQEIDS